MSDVFIHPTAVVDEPVSLGSGTKIWHFCHVMSGATLGPGCSLGQNVFVSGTVVMGANCKVQNNVSLYDGVVCGDDVFLGPSCVFTNVSTPRSAVNRRGAYEPTILGKGVTVGANATIVCGSRLGAHAFVGAGAVVTRDVPAYALVIGVPARISGWACACGIRLETAPGAATCSDCGATYRCDDNGAVIGPEER
jgi:UDP-2-acetamido-3-amino-2,3-dideoxy-glucuronate N-acetyltransferase